MIRHGLRFLKSPMALVALLAGMGAAGRVAAPAAKAPITFEDQVQPILKAHCWKCHAGAEPKKGLRLTSRREMLEGGMSGPALRIAAAESSLLWEKLASNEMPKDGPPLTAQEKGLIRTWINEGAPSADAKQDDATTAVKSGVSRPDGHWSFKPVVRPAVPTVRGGDRVRNPVDAFVLAALEAKELGMSAQASPQALLRRAHFALTGLPPSPEQVAEFLADTAPGSYERMIDRLLASPHYGEHWGRHWLDLAGYADSAGILNEDRPLQSAYRYRDYVIGALNRDKPYDRFLLEQIAGDELTGYWAAHETQERLSNEVIEAITATGFLRCAADASRPDFNTIKNADAQYFYPTLNDTLQIVASSTLGLTLQCARCHSHKFDPIPQGEFYQMQAIFMPALRPKQWIPQAERRLQAASASQKKSAAERNAKVDAEIARLRKELAAERANFKKQLMEQRLGGVPEAIRADVQRALSKAAAQRTPVESYLADKFQPTLQPDDKTLDKVLPETYAPYRTALDTHTAAVAAQERQRVSFDEIRALYDLPGPVATPLLLRGDALTPGPLVTPGVLSAIATPVAFQWTAPADTTKSSGRRLAFARWLTQPGHPLTARVLVNRVWHHHFGEGIVATPEDFGKLGATPSHPELLDWLSTEFVKGGWSVKHLHRLILTSSAYRQGSRVDAVAHTRALKADPENRLLWRQRLRRLEAEPMRDAMLSAAGVLDPQLFGSPIPVARRPDGEVNVADGQSDRRRSIYLQVLRGNPHTLMHAHDQPVMEINCTRRARSTVATQSLTLLNSDAVIALAMALADRALKQSPQDPARFAVLAALSREAAPQELAALHAFSTAQAAHYARRGDGPDAARRLALADLCHMLMVANEFAYVD